MTQRERTMATVAGATAVVVLGLVGVFMFKNAIDASQEKILNLQGQVEEAKLKIDMVRRDGPILQRWRRMSLIGDPKQARAEYRQYLDTLITKNGLSNEQFPGAETGDTRSPIVHPSKPGKVPIYQGLVFQVKLRGTLENLVKFLKEFQSAKKMHRIKQITIERAGRSATDLLVGATFEALMIHDADKAGGVEEKFDGRFVVMDTFASLSNGVNGLGALRWTTFANSSASPNLVPLNQPHTARDYVQAIKDRNPFTGPENIVEPPPGPRDNYGDRWPEDDINMMRFMHFGAIINNEKLVDEAWLWDQYTNESRQLRTSGGFNKFPLLQTGQSGSFEKIILGQVIQIEESSLVFRVTLKASDATYVSSKWWRYPQQANYYIPHDEDFAELVKLGKVREGEKDFIYIVPKVNWDRLTRAGNEQIQLLTGGTAFRVPENGTTGEIVMTDKDVTVIRMGYDPPGGAYKPTIPYTRFYPEEKAIYRVGTKHFSDLVADKNLPRERTVKPGDIERIYVTRAKYWDELVYHRIVREEGGGADFKFYGDLIGGEIIARTEGEMIVFRIWEDYCHCRGYAERNIKDHWHPGFLVLHMDGQVQDAVWTPWDPEKVKQYLKASAPADGK